MFEVGNSNLIILNEELGKCFDSRIINKLDLYKLCIPHINAVHTQKIEELQENAINSQFYVESLVDIMYEDKSSLFWIHPSINALVYNNAKLSYSWKELCDQFVYFVKQNKNIERLDELTFYIKPNSCLSNYFRFSHFTLTQIPSILKQLTKFLGKSTNLFTLCENLCLDSSLTTAINFIENIVQTNNNSVTYISLPAYI